MTIEINQLVLYVIILLAVAGGGGAILYAKREIKLTNEDFNFAKTVLKMALYVSKEYDWEYEDELEDIMEYVLIGLDNAIELNDIDIMTVKDFKEYVFAEARELCQMNQIVIDEDLEGMLNMAIDYLITKLDLSDN